MTIVFQPLVSVTSFIKIFFRVKYFEFFVAQKIGLKTYTFTQLFVKDYLFCFKQTKGEGGLYFLCYYIY